MVSLHSPAPWSSCVRIWSQIHLTAWDDEAVVLLCHGDVIDEPVVAHGPFVMNTEAEIREAFEEYQSGQFGRVGR